MFLGVLGVLNACVPVFCVVFVVCTLRVHISFFVMLIYGVFRLYFFWVLWLFFISL